MNRLTRKQFDILVCAEKNKAPMTQREIAEETGMSIGSVNRAVSALTEAGMIHGQRNRSRDCKNVLNYNP